MLMDLVQKARMESLTPGSTRSLSSPNGVLRNKRLQLPSHVLHSLYSSHQPTRLRPTVAASVVLRSWSLRTAVSAGPVAGDTALRICIVYTVKSASRAPWVAGANKFLGTCMSTGSLKMSARPSAIVLLFEASGSWLPASKIGWPAHKGMHVLPAGTSAEVQYKVTVRTHCRQGEA